MAAPVYRWLITNGELGTLDNQIATYSSHPNGRRALMRAIQQHADQTGRESWAEMWPHYLADDRKPINRYYPRKPERES